MIENPQHPFKEKRWKLQVGPGYFEDGPLKQFASNSTALHEFNKLREITQPLVTGAAEIPAMAMRPGQTSIIPLLRYLPSLFRIISNGVEASTGPFAPYINGPIFNVTDPWLRNWLDALAFSLSGLPADRTSAGAMAYVLFDMHRQGAALDYPQGGLGKVVDALVHGVEQKDNGSKVHLRRHVESIDTDEDGTRVVGLTVRKSGGDTIIVKARDGVICNAPIWSLRHLIKNNKTLRFLGGGSIPREITAQQSWMTSSSENPDTGRRSVLRSRADTQSNVSTENMSLLEKCDQAELTGSFLHLHVALNKTGIDMSTLEPHYTVMDRGLGGDGSVFRGVQDGPCGELNMIAVSNPCVLDDELAPDGFIIVHAYGAGNEPFDVWKPENKNYTEMYQTETYKALKEERAKPLWRAIESIIPDAKERAVLALVGSPRTHQRYLRRPFGSYGAAFEDCLSDGSTPLPNMFLAGDGVFPGIGIPAVALNGASAANAMVGVLDQWFCMDALKSKNLL